MDKIFDAIGGIFLIIIFIVIFISIIIAIISTNVALGIVMVPYMQEWASGFLDWVSWLWDGVAGIVAR